MKFNQNQDYWVNIFATNEFFSIETYSGFGMIGMDPIFPPHLLRPDADDNVIGEKIMQALSDSRTLEKLEERVVFFDLENCKKQYESRILKLMQIYNYKNRKSLFKNMSKCGVHLINDVITISPSYHEKLESWGRVSDDGIDDVVLSVRNSPSEIGAGFRLALRRCQG